MLSSADSARCALRSLNAGSRYRLAISANGIDSSASVISMSTDTDVSWSCNVSFIGLSSGVELCQCAVNHALHSGWPYFLHSKVMDADCGNAVFLRIFAECDDLADVDFIAEVSGLRCRFHKCGYRPYTADRRADRKQRRSRVG